MILQTACGYASDSSLASYTIGFEYKAAQIDQTLYYLYTDTANCGLYSVSLADGKLHREEILEDQSFVQILEVNDSLYLLTTQQLFCLQPSGKITSVYTAKESDTLRGVYPQGNCLYLVEWGKEIGTSESKLLQLDPESLDVEVILENHRAIAGSLESVILHGHYMYYRKNDFDLYCLDIDTMEESLLATNVYAQCMCGDQILGMGLTLPSTKAERWNRWRGFRMEP